MPPSARSVGGAIGAAVSDGDDQLIAILAGATIGAIIGHEIGEEMDDDDRRMLRPFAGTARGRPARHLGRQPGRPDLHACADGRFERDGQVCRSFSLLRQYDGRQVTKRASACRFGEGDWRMIKT